MKLSSKKSSQNTDPDHERLRNDIGCRHDGGSLLRFLEDPLSHAHTLTAFTSVIRTLAKQGARFIAKSSCHWERHQ